MSKLNRTCPDCQDIDRRDFLRVAGASAAIASTAPLAMAAEAKAVSTPESVVKHLYETLTPGQKEKMCFAWDYNHPQRGLLRTRISANWNITQADVMDDFNEDQQKMIRDIYEGIVSPEWVAKFDKQLEDDCGGFGSDQSIAIFGEPNKGKFEFVLTGRHMTMRCDGNSTDHVAFGGPIFYGHDPDGSGTEGASHQGNVFWEQAIVANDVYKMLDEEQRQEALHAKAPRESAVKFKGKGGNFDGIAVKELEGHQKEGVQKVLKKLIEPYRQSDRDEVVKCLNAQGGLDECYLCFYEAGDLGKDKVWDNWRLHGPAFVWHFRGSPHVHTWVNVADDPSVKLNA